MITKKRNKKACKKFNIFNAYKSYICIIFVVYDECPLIDDIYGANVANLSWQYLTVILKFTGFCKL